MIGMIDTPFCSLYFLNDRYVDTDERWSVGTLKHINILCTQSFDEIYQLHLCPSGLRGSTQVRMYSYSWVQIPPDAFLFAFGSIVGFV